MRRAAFTLLETLLAISLTVSVGIAAVAMTTMQARLSATARTQEEALAVITETARLLDDDLLLAVKPPGSDRFQVLETGALRLVTACQLPGDPPGLHRVVWSLDAASGTVLRSATPLGGGETTVHRIGGAWQAFAVGVDHDALWLYGRLGAASDLWRLPLWTDGP